LQNYSLLCDGIFQVAKIFLPKFSKCGVKLKFSKSHDEKKNRLSVGGGRCEKWILIFEGVLRFFSEAKF
jgi:hypothetical protein